MEGGSPGHPSGPGGYPQGGVNSTEVFLVLLDTLADPWEVEDINMAVVDMDRLISLMLQHHLMRPLSL